MDALINNPRLYPLVLLCALAAFVILLHFLLQVWLWKLRDMEKRLDRASLNLKMQQEASRRTHQALLDDLLTKEKIFMDARREAYRSDHPLRRRSDRNLND